MKRRGVCSLGKFFLLTLVSMGLFAANASAGVTHETCAQFYNALEQVPHESIFQHDGMFASQYLEVGVNGCVVVMITNDERLNGHTLPDFSAESGDSLAQSGWRNEPKYAADGPGTGFWGLEKDNVLCLFYMNQPASFNESGEIVQSSYVNARVECLDLVQGPCPDNMGCEETAQSK